MKGLDTHADLIYALVCARDCCKDNIALTNEIDATMLLIVEDIKKDYMPVELPDPVGVTE